MNTNGLMHLSTSCVRSLMAMCACSSLLLECSNPLTTTSGFVVVVHCSRAKEECVFLLVREAWRKPISEPTKSKKSRSRTEKPLTYRFAQRQESPSCWIKSLVGHLPTNLVFGCSDSVSDMFLMWVVLFPDRRSRAKHSLIKEEKPISKILA